MTLDGYGSEGFNKQTQEIIQSVEQLDKLDRFDLLRKLRRLISQSGEDTTLAQLLTSHTNEELLGEKKQALEATWKDTLDQPEFQELWEEWQAIKLGTKDPKRAEQLDRANLNKIILGHYNGKHIEAQEEGGKLLEKNRQQIEVAKNQGDQELAFNLSIFRQVALVNVAQAYWFNGKVHKSLKLWEEADGMYNPETDIEAMRSYGVNAKCHILNLSGSAYMELGDLEKGTQYNLQGLAYAKELADFASVGMGFMSNMFGATLIRDFDTVVDFGKKMEEEIEREGYDADHFNYPKMIYYPAIGKPEKGEEIIRMYKSFGQNIGLGCYAHFAAIAYFKLGEKHGDRSYFKKAFHLTHDFVEHSLEIKEGVVYPYIMCSMARSLYHYPEGIQESKMGADYWEDKDIDYWLDRALNCAKETETIFYELDVLVNRYEITELRENDEPGKFTEKLRLEKVQLKDFVNELKTNPDCKYDVEEIRFPLWETAKEIAGVN